MRNMILEGQTLDNAVSWMYASIRARGYGLVTMPGPATWSYTVGLTEMTGHPELVVAQVKPETADALLSELAPRVLRGEVMNPDTIVEVGDYTFPIGAVHQTRLDAGLMPVWTAYAARYGVAAHLRALQVQMPDDWYCRCHAGSQPRLDLPGGLPGPPNREWRRSAKRHGRRP
jgi:hypothetical protein